MQSIFIKNRRNHTNLTTTWEQRELEEVITVGNGMDYKHLSEGDIPVYGTGGYMLSVDKALSYDKDAIGIGRKGTIDKPYVLKAPFWTVDTLFYCIPKENFSLDFVYCVFQNVNWKEKDESTGVPSLSKVNINSTGVKVPALAEQEKIGAYFSNLDSLITLHQRKYSLLFIRTFEILKEACFFLNVNAWEQREFGNIANRMSETSLSSDELPYIEYEDVISNQGILNKDVSTKEGVKTGIVFSEEDVLYGKLRPYLHNWLNPDFKGVAVGDWWVLKPINADKNFLYRLIQSENFDNVANQSTGTKMPRADWKLVSATVFCVPKSLEEQAEIGQYFRNLDHLITLHQRKPFQRKNGGKNYVRRC